MRQLSHENICEFIGANFEAPHPIILTSFAQKGKLQDILANDDIKLDWMFKCSLISDLVNVSYLYISKLIFSLISRCCYNGQQFCINFGQLKLY